MFIKRPWAFWRRLQYLTGFALIGVGILTYLYFAYLHTDPTCFDGTQNGEETGVDCGGGCVRICADTVTPPAVLWARSFEVNDGQYNAVAYVENRNRTAGAPVVPYTFTIYDGNDVIATRSGTTVLPPDSVYPIFEGRIYTPEGRTPTRTFLELNEPSEWLPASSSVSQFSVVARSLTSADRSPRLDATLYNTLLTEAREVEVVATIFDRSRNALTSSRTIVENFAPRTETDVVFTWPQPIAKTVRSCEIPTDVLLGIDLSGSMNDDGGMPPEPISSVLSAAEAFIARLQTDDQAGLVTFATDATLTAPLQTSLDTVASRVRGLQILPAEEQGVTNTGAAFTVAREHFATNAHNSDARSVFVILTDGRATAPGEDPDTFARERATELKESGVSVYAIGLGENVDMELVTAIADNSSQAYQALSARDVDRIYRDITSAICEDGAAIIEIIPKTGASFERPANR